MAVETRPAAVHTAHVHAHDHESAPFREVLRERLIQPRTMRRELRLILGVAVAQLLVAGILLGLKELDGGAFAPSLYAFPAAEGNGFELISATAFVIGIVITSAAWAYVLAGAFRAGWLVRVLILGIFGWAFVSERDALAGLGSGTTAVCIALVAAVFVVGAVTFLPEMRLHRRRRAGQPEAPGRWRWVRNAEVPALFLLVGGLYLTVFLASHAFDVANPVATVDNSQVATFSNDVFNQIDNLQYLLIPLLVLAGSDFGEWGQLVMSRVARSVRTRTSSGVFAILALVVGAVIAADGLVTANGPEGGGALEELLLGAVVCLTAAGLYALARPRGGWGAGVPFVAIAVVAVLDTVSGFITQALQASSDHLNDYIQLGSAGLWVLGGAAAVVTLAVGRGRLSPGVTAGLVFVGLIGVVDLLGSLWVLGNFDNAPLGITADNAPFLGPEGLRAAAGVLTVLVVGAAVLRRRVREWAVPISVLLVTAATLELLSYIDLLYANKGKLEALPPIGGLAIGGTVILVAALLWDLAVSGEAITNVEGHWLPRDTRVLVFVGYILLVSSAVLMFASLHAQSGKLLESSFDPEAWVRQGILFLGIPLTIALGIAALHRWRWSTEPATPAAHES